MIEIPIPSSVRVGGIIYDVVLRDLSELGVLGRTDLNGQEIAIEESSPIQARAVTLIHEITHCVLRAGGLGYEDVIEVAEEELVQRMEAGLLDVFRDARLAGWINYALTYRAEAQDGTQ